MEDLRFRSEYAAQVARERADAARVKQARSLDGDAERAAPMGAASVLALFWLALAAGTAVVSLVVGVALEVPAQRAVSGGLMLVGSVVFTAGAAAGIRDPARSSRRERLLRRGPAESRPTSWQDAFQLSAALVGWE